MLREPQTLPQRALARAWEWEDIGEPHPAIGPVADMPDHEGADELDLAIRAALTKAGWYRRGRVAAEFADVLLTIANAERECYGWITTPARGPDRTVLVAATDVEAVKVVRTGEWITLERTQGTNLYGGVLDELPELSAADLEPFVVACADYPPRTTVALEDATTPDAAQLLAGLMAAERSGTHQLYTAVRTNGTRRRSAPLTATDTVDYGRVLTYLQPGEDGELQIACQPGTRRQIATSLAYTTAALREQ